MTPLLPALLLALPAFADPPMKLAVKDQGGCTAEDRGVIDKARAAARQRAQTSRDFVKSATAKDADEKAAAKFKKWYLFLDTSWDPAAPAAMQRILGQIDGLIEKADYRCQPPTDVECGFRAGYVDRREDANVVHLCRRFFDGSDSGRAATLTHEAAHVLDLRITDLDANGSSSYCGMYDCEGRCSDGPVVDGRQRPFFVADNWAHFMHCASGQKAEVFEIVVPVKKKK